MHALNLGILAHVDAGKTTLTERLLYAAGVIDKLGSVDAGTTQTDSLELERRRGITIRSAVVSLPLDGVPVNLIDTPGHPDFIAEVERVLSVLDGAVLVLSAVEGVQAQSRVLLRALRRLRIPTLLFVNKIDRRDAGYDRVLAALAAGIVELLPAAAGDVAAPVSGRIFKIERGPAGEKVAYVRLFAGTIRTRDRLRLPGDQDGAPARSRVTAAGAIEQGGKLRRGAVHAGEIGKLWGLDPVRVGDAVGTPPAAAAPGQFAPPLLALGRLGAGAAALERHGELATVEATLPAARVQELARRLPGLTGGEGTVEYRFSGYEPVRADPPTRTRSTPDPLGEEYLAWLRGRG